MKLIDLSFGGCIIYFLHCHKHCMGHGQTISYASFELDDELPVWRYYCLVSGDSRFVLFA